MDFHSLPRRQLQTLCKQYKIPANTTNVAMATALDNLLNKNGNGSDGEMSGLSGLDLLTPCKSTAESMSVEKTGLSVRITRSQRKKQIEDMRKFEILEPGEEMTETGLPAKKKPPISTGRRSMVTVSTDQVVGEDAVESNNQKPPLSTVKKSRRKVIMDNSDREESAISQQESDGSKVAQRDRRGRCQRGGKECPEEVFGNVFAENSEVARNGSAVSSVEFNLIKGTDDQIVAEVDPSKMLPVQMSALSLESSGPGVENDLVLNVEDVTGIDLVPKREDYYSTVQDFQVQMDGQTCVGEFDGLESHISKTASQEEPGVSNSDTAIHPTVEAEPIHVPALIVKQTKQESEGNSSDTEAENESSDCLDVTDEIQKLTDGAESDLSQEDAIVNETKEVSSDVQSVLKEPEGVAPDEIPTVVHGVFCHRQIHQEVRDDVPVEESGGNSFDTETKDGTLEVTEETEKFKDGEKSEGACEDVVIETEGVDSIGPDEISSSPPTVVRDVSSQINQQVPSDILVEENDGSSSSTTAVEGSGESSLLAGEQQECGLDDVTEKHKETVVNDHAGDDVEQLSSALAEVKLNEDGQVQEEGKQDASGKDSSLGKMKMQKKHKKVGHGKENPLFNLSLRKLTKLHKELHEKKKKKSAPRNDGVTPLSPNARKNNCAH